MLKFTWILLACLSVAGFGNIVGPREAYRSPHSFRLRPSLNEIATQCRNAVTAYGEARQNNLSEEEIDRRRRVWVGRAEALRDAALDSPEMERVIALLRVRFPGVTYHPRMNGSQNDMTFGFARQIPDSDNNEIE